MDRIGLAKTISLAENMADCLRFGSMLLPAK
jgi:hypothetical protein